jgi:hypothetical protein
MEIGREHIQEPTGSGGLRVKGEIMFQSVTKIIKWIALPALLIASLFAGSAAWAGGFGGVAVLYIPLLPGVRIFLLMTVAFIPAFVTLVSAFRPQPVPEAL